MTMNSWASSKWLKAFAPDFIPSILSGAMTLYKMPEHNTLLVDDLRKAGFAD